MADLRNTRGVRRDPSQYIDQQEARDRGRRELGYAQRFIPIIFTAKTRDRTAQFWALNLCDTRTASGGGFILQLPSVVGRHGDALMIQTTSAEGEPSVLTKTGEIMGGAVSDVTTDVTFPQTLWLIADETHLTWQVVLYA